MPMHQVANSRRDLEANVGLDIKSHLSVKGGHDMACCYSKIWKDLKNRLLIGHISSSVFPYPLSQAQSEVHLKHSASPISDEHSQNDRDVKDDENPRPAKQRKLPPCTYRQRSDTTLQLQPKASS
jgi:hypothetical protein